MSSAPALESLSYSEARQRDEDAHEARIGRTFRHWRVEASEGTKSGAGFYRCACVECGTVEVLGTAELLAATPCLSCFAGRPEYMDEPSVQAMARLAAVPRLDPDLPWSQDVDARAWAWDHEESTLEELGRALGISRQAVAAIEKAALAKLRDAMIEAGYGPDDALVRAWKLITHHKPPKG